MDSDEVRTLLESVAEGSTTASEALHILTAGPLRDEGAGTGVADLGFARLDTGRGLRTGDPEVIYGAGKTPDQVVALLQALADGPGNRPALATRLGADARTAVRAAIPDASIDDVARTAVVGELPVPRGIVTVVAAGTSDGPVAAEAAVVARAFGAGVVRIDDVGVAGLHRLLAVRDQLEAADCLVVVAGMEGALPSVVGGLVGVPLIAVPTSVGYGASFGGLAALLGMLNSCAAGVAVCNIDNGFGAGVFAARVARRAMPAAAGPRVQDSREDNEPLAPQLHEQRGLAGSPQTRVRTSGRQRSSVGAERTESVGALSLTPPDRQIGAILVGDGVERRPGGTA